MRLEKKKEAMQRILDEIYATTGEIPLAYGNFIDTIENYDRRKQHRLLDEALQDIEKYLDSYPEDWYG